MQNVIFQKGVDNFEIEHKTCLFLVRVQFPLKQLVEKIYLKCGIWEVGYKLLERPSTCPDQPFDSRFCGELLRIPVLSEKKIYNLVLNI